MSRGQRLRYFVSLLCVAAGPVGLFHASAARAGEGQVDAQSDAATTEARKQFQAGVNLLDDPDGARYEEALFAFRKAYELSHSPKILGNVGFCAMHLERDGEAIEAYTEYLSKASEVDSRERAQIQKDLTTLTTTSARFRATMKEPGKYVLVDTRIVGRGSPIVNSYPFEGNDLTVRLRPGRHSFMVKSAASETTAFEMSIEPAASTAHSFAFPALALSEAPSVAPSPPSRVGPIALGIAGLAAIGVGAVTGVMANSKASDIDSKCPNETCPRGYDVESDKSSAHTLSTIANVSFIGGGLMIGGAVTWYLLQSKGHSRESARTPQWISADCTGHGCGVQLRGRFQ